MISLPKMDTRTKGWRVLVRARNDSKDARRSAATIHARKRSVFKQHERQYPGTSITLHPALTSRLSKYLRVCLQLVEEGYETVSSRELGGYMGVNPGLVRRDLLAIGSSGTRGVGYQIHELVKAVRDALGLGRTYNLALVGAGKLGSTIAASTILPKRGFVVREVFDNDPAKLGHAVGNTTVKHVEELKSSVAESRVVIGIIATPTSAGQEVVDKMVDAGISVIINYTDALLCVPHGVDVHRVYPVTQLMHTLYYLTDASCEGRRYVPPPKRLPDPFDEPGRPGWQ